jgi:hypothetical protein
VKKDPIYEKLQNRLKEVAVVSPQTLGPLTPVYKKITSQVKSWPLKVIVPVAFIGGAVFQLLFGDGIVKIVSVLQGGF